MKRLEHRLLFKQCWILKKKDVEPYRAVYEEHIQLLHDVRNHWILSFCSNGCVQVCDSLNTALTRSSRKAIRSLYKHYFSGDEVISFLPVQRQPDGYNCGLFAIASAAEILDGKSPLEAIFSVDEMRGHLISCMETQKLSSFPRVSNVWYIVESSVTHTWEHFLIFVKFLNIFKEFRISL